MARRRRAGCRSVIPRRGKPVLSRTETGRCRQGGARNQGDCQRQRTHTTCYFGRSRSRGSRRGSSGRSIHRSRGSGRRGQPWHCQRHVPNQGPGRRRVCLTCSRTRQALRIGCLVHGQSRGGGGLRLGSHQNRRTSRPQRPAQAQQRHHGHLGREKLPQPAAHGPVNHGLVQPGL